MGWDFSIILKDFSWCLKLAIVDEFRNSASREFHNVMDEGLHDLRAISVLQNKNINIVLIS